MSSWNRVKYELRVSMVRGLALWASGLGGSVMGCGGAPPSATESASGWPGPSAIPVTPRTEGVLDPFSDVHTPPTLAQVDLSQNPSKIVWSMPLLLAVGPSYPSTYTATVKDVLNSTCGGASEGSFQGTVTLREVAGSTPAVAGVVRNDARVIVSVTDEADLTLVVTGEVDVTNPGGCALAGLHPFELRLAVSAFRPRGTSFDVPPACAEARVKRVAPGRQMSDSDRYLSGVATAMFRPLPLNPTGRAVQVANAAPLAQVAIQIDGPPARGRTPAAPPAQLDDLVFPDVPGQVRFMPEVGDPFAVEVIEPRQVDRIDIALQVAGYVGTPFSLSDNGNYDLELFNRKQNRVDPRVMDTSAGGERLCSLPSPSWFTFDSFTPETCETMPVEPPDPGLYQFDGNSIRQGGRFLADGTCSMSVRAPQLNGGAGYDQTWTFQIRNVAKLHDRLTPSP